MRGTPLVMSSPVPPPQIVAVRTTSDSLNVDLRDGRSLTVPLAWYPRLARATPEQRGNWQLIGGGLGVHWPDVDEDLSAEGLLRGAPAPGVPRDTAS